MAANGKTFDVHLETLSELLGLDITHDVISVSTPGSQIYPGNEKLSVGLARLLNEVSSPQ